MKAIFDLAEKFLEAGGIRKDIILLVIAGISILLSDYSVRSEHALKRVQRMPTAV